LGMLIKTLLSRLRGLAQPEYKQTIIDRSKGIVWS